MYLDLNLKYCCGAVEQKHTFRIQFISSCRTSFFQQMEVMDRLHIRAATPRLHQRMKELGETVYTYNKV